MSTDTLSSVIRKAPRGWHHGTVGCVTAYDTSIPFQNTASGLSYSNIDRVPCQCALKRDRVTQVLGPLHPGGRGRWTPGFSLAQL